MFQTLSILAIGVAVAFAVVHKVLFGVKRFEDAAGGRPVRRWTWFEVLVHLLTAAGFLVLAATGFATWTRRHGLSGWMLWVHFMGGGAFLLGLTAMVLRWAAENRFDALDWQWLKSVGGYFSRRSPVTPAGKYDCGQKILFWLAASLGLVSAGTVLVSMVPLFGSESQVTLIGIHRYSGLLLVVAVILHTYVSLVVKSGAWRTMLWGRVNSNWARCYHPQWQAGAAQDSKEEAFAR